MLLPHKTAHSDSQAGTRLVILFSGFCPPLLFQGRGCRDFAPANASGDKPAIMLGPSIGEKTRLYPLPHCGHTPPIRAMMKKQLTEASLMRKIMIVVVLNISEQD